MLARQSPHFGGGDVGRVAHDDIVAPAFKSFIDIGATDAHAALKPVTPDVVPGDVDRPWRDVGCIHAGPRQGVRRGNRDATGSRADVEYALYARWIDPGRESGQAKLRDRRARNEHVRRHADLVPGEPADTGEVCGRQSLVDAAFQERARPRGRARRHGQSIACGRRFVREAERVEDERRRLVPRVVGPVAIVKSRFPQPSGGPIEQLADICERQAGVAHPGSHGRQSNRLRPRGAAVG